MRKGQGGSPTPKAKDYTNLGNLRIFKESGDKELISSLCPVHWKGKMAKINLSTESSRFLYENKIRKLVVVTHQIGGIIVLRPLKPDEIELIYKAGFGLIGDLYDKQEKT